MVEALHDYEFGLFVSSFFGTVFVGFLVAKFQAAPAQAKILGIISIIAAIATVAFFGWALVKRSKMTARSKAFKLQTGGVQEIKDA